jgi:hypothetical protein
MDAPLRDLTADEIQRYEEEGVLHARGLFPEAWLERMCVAVDRFAAQPSPFGDAVSMQDQGFSGDLFLWKLDADFLDFVFQSPAARIAAQVLRSRTIRHFYDQLFVKQAGSPVATPWHQDVTFWPVDVDTRRICSIWISFDAVDRESSGLEFVRGSHRWSRRFKAVAPNYDPYLLESSFEDPPDIDAARDDYEIFSPDIEPGDCLLFNPQILHGSAGNASLETPRRAFSSRWAAAGVRYDDRPATMPLLWEHGLVAGDALSGPLFPQLLPEPIPAEVAGRTFPEPPDPTAVKRAVQAALAARARAGSRSKEP